MALFSSLRTSCSWSFGLFLLLTLLALAACSGDQEANRTKQARQRPDLPVTTAVAGKKTVPVELAATGHVEAEVTVGIRSQVTGLLQTVHFREGDTVKRGDLLFTIDPRPFAAALAKAEAALDKDRAELDNARRELDRYAQAAKKGFVSAEQADQAATLEATLTASINK
jgi:multidrug efflux system membrane fusion protein